MRNLSPHDLSEGLLIVVTRKGIEPFNRPRIPNLFSTYRSLRMPFNALSDEIY